MYCHVVVYTLFLIPTITITGSTKYIPAFNKIKRIPNPKIPHHLTIGVIYISNCLFERKKWIEREMSGESEFQRVRVIEVCVFWLCMLMKSQSSLLPYNICNLKFNLDATIALHLFSNFWWNQIMKNICQSLNFNNIWYAPKIYLINL